MPRNPVLNGRSTFKVKCHPYWSGVWERGWCYKGGYTGGHPASSELGVSKALVILITASTLGVDRFVPHRFVMRRIVMSNQPHRPVCTHNMKAPAVIWSPVHAAQYEIERQRHQGIASS